ncbi:phosphoribosyltransferase domain-containing protein, partial [Vibrio parahaemolyticus]
TRSILPHAERWFEISESHSHAVSHIIYKPSQEMLDSLIDVENLILVDDEITTGNTLKQLAKEYLKVLPN